MQRIFQRQIGVMMMIVEIMLVEVVVISFIG